MARSSSVHGAGRDDRASPIGGGFADGLGGAFHFGEAATIGADGDELAVVEFELDAAEGVAAAFVVGRKNRTADQLTEQASGNFVITGFGELGDRREILRVFRGEFELAAFAADLGAIGTGFDAERSVAAFAEDRAEAGDGEHGSAGDIDLDAIDFVADADFEVGGHQRGVVLGDFEFHVLQNRLGAASRRDRCDRLEGVQHLLAVDGDLHRVESPFTRRRILVAVLDVCDCACRIRVRRG